MTLVTFKIFVGFAFITIVVTNTMSKAFGGHGDNAPRAVPAHVQDTFIHQTKANASNSFNYEYSLLPGEDPVKKINENAFVTVSTDKKEYYQNDLVLVTYKMYSRLVDETSIYQMPSFTGFYSFKMRQPTDDDAVEYFRNKFYRVRTLYEILLVPFTTGKLTLSSMEVNCAVQFIRRTKQTAAKTNTLDELLDQIDEEESMPKIVQKIILKSEPVILEIHHLPTDQLPGFGGTVGQFMLRDSIAKPEFLVGEINKLELTLTGRGYSPITDTPKINWPSGFVVENIESKDNYDEQDFYAKGIKKITYFFSVNKEGDYTIPPSSFSYFDPAQTNYKPLHTNAYILHVKVRDGSSRSTHDQNRTPKKDGFFSKNFTTSKILLTIGVAVVILLSVLSLGRSFLRSEKNPEG
ncbi:MAG: BatD family protein [Ferruginibacter sp.]